MPFSQSVHFAVGPLLLLALVGCGPPRIDTGRVLTDSGPPPEILPLDQVLAQSDVPGLEPTDTAALQSRAGALQRRAEALAATSADPETRARLDAAIEAKTN